MTRILSVAALAASVLLACSSSSGGTTTGAVAGTGTTTSSTSGTTSGTSGTSGTTSGAATTSSSSGSSSGSTDYCNGSELVSAASTDLYVSTYPETDDIRTGCDSVFDLLSEPDAGFVFEAMGGILDANSNSNQAGLLTLSPSGCEDLDAGAAPAITASTITPPTGASTIAAARASQLDGGTIYGIVTYIDSPYWDAKEMKAEDAYIYLQDLPDAGGPANLSGIEIYIDDKFTTATGTVGYPDSGLARGDVVAISGLSWSAFTQATEIQDQYSYTSSSVVTVLGTQPLPTAIPLTATEIANGGGQNYLGMRVIQTDVPDTVTSGCPAQLYSP